MNIDHKYMLRSIKLGEKALGTAAPNPMVGAVIVHENRIIGEGFTSPFGGPHAEVNAINSVGGKSKLKGATLYVTLEPCSHFGKTPPCSDLIIKHKIPRVVLGLVDPNDKVAGRGVKKLRDAGCEVTIGVLEDECRELHKRFLTLQEKKRPYVILKWAETADGFIAPKAEKRNQNPNPVWITNSKSRQLVHKWRSEEMAILVGTETVLADNPKLDVRLWKGKNPIRLVLDRNLRIPHDFHIMDGSCETIVFTGNATNTTDSKVSFQEINFSQSVPQQICDMLFSKDISSVLIEGGTRTLQSFIDDNLWDEARIFVGGSSFGDGIQAPIISGKTMNVTSILNDSLTILKND